MKRTKPIHRWTKEETDYLIENYGKITADEIASYLGLPTRKVITKATILGLISGRSWKTGKKYRTIQKTEFTPELVGANLGSSINTEYLCKYCGNIFITIPYRVNCGKTTSCGCYKPHLRKGTDYVTATYFKRLIRGAELRDLEFSITLEYVSDLLESQGHKCALSGRNISCKYKQEITASLDRIDSDKGYIEGNVQWVHKEVNFMKHYLSQKDFIELCIDISNYAKKAA